MNSVFNIVSNNEWAARVYFELDPTGKICFSTIHFLNEGSKNFINRNVDDLQNEVKQELNNRFGQSNYKIILSEHAEREKYEKLFYSKFYLNK